jgi:hypothetical protein
MKAASKKQIAASAIAGAMLLAVAAFLRTFPHPFARIIAVMFLLWGLGGMASGLVRFLRAQSSKDE